jgi:chromosome segregation ATPase
MSAKETKVLSEERSVAEVERIREIIFGSQMRDYDRQFATVVDQLGQLNKDLEALRAALDQQGADQDERTRELQEETRQRRSELNQELSGRIGQLEAKITQVQDEARRSRDELHNEMSSRLERQDTEQKSQLRKLAAELRQQNQDLRNDLTAALNALEDKKTSRSDLGDLLEEMGMRLKGQGEIAELLEQLE